MIIQPYWTMLKFTPVLCVNTGVVYHVDLLCSLCCTILAVKLNMIMSIVLC
jgi:hypothetical protein